MANIPKGDDWKKAALKHRVTLPWDWGTPPPKYIGQMPDAPPVPDTIDLTKPENVKLLRWWMRQMWAWGVHVRHDLVVAEANIKALQGAVPAQQQASTVPQAGGDPGDPPDDPWE